MDREGYRLFQATRAGVCAGYVEDSRGDIARDDIAPILLGDLQKRGRVKITLAVFCEVWEG